MAAVAKLPHTLTSGGKTYVMILPDEYESASSTVGTVLGINKVTGALPTGTDKLTLKAGLNAGIIFHVAISYKINGVRKRSKLVCGRDHISGGLALAGSTFRGQPIISSVIPEHLTFS
ncbi:hypothetical protein PQG02_06960 [Nostoc sp. UHCC 0926]|uniref:hypothetical protein n=1 Tax=unclassified Nostoc TaxID=2593658 RepID=UPI00235FE72D|nr:hypothetical protein [Nostoc sp. UHCC 0926]WDD34081.1 hypothetical protein PQG02_06960 [Nostoc sp. UHCC 0926]